MDEEKSGVRLTAEHVARKEPFMLAFRSDKRFIISVVAMAIFTVGLIRGGFWALRMFANGIQRISSFTVW